MKPCQQEAPLSLASRPPLTFFFIPISVAKFGWSYSSQCRGASACMPVPLEWPAEALSGLSESGRSGCGVHRAASQRIAFGKAGIDAYRSFGSIAPAGLH